MPWIGINDATLEYFGLTRKSVSIDSDTAANKEYIKKLVKTGMHPSDAKSDNAGKRDNRFKHVDVNFLQNERVEIDAILAKVGSQRFWEYIMDKLTHLFPTRNYNRAIELPTEYYSKEEGFDTLPEAIKKVLIHIEAIAHIAIKPTKEEIISEMDEINGFLEVPEKKKNNSDRLSKVLAEDRDMKVIISKFQELLAPGVLPKTKHEGSDNDTGQKVI
jgi:hypothetical protein